MADIQLPICDADATSGPSAGFRFGGSPSAELGVSMRHRCLVLTIALATLGAAFLASTQPARAAEIPADEPLVMRIIFEDCLGYIRHDRIPFQGLATRPASPAAVKELRSPVLSRRGAVELLSPRYIASWGAASDSRFCVLQTIWDGDREPAPRLLGVRPEGFIDRVSARAVAEKISERDGGEAFSPLSITRWHEPDTGHDSGPKRPVSFTIMPTDKSKDGTIFEAGLLVMGGPPLAVDPSLPSSESPK